MISDVRSRCRCAGALVSLTLLALAGCSGNGVTPSTPAGSQTAMQAGQPSSSSPASSSPDLVHVGHGSGRRIALGTALTAIPSTVSYANGTISIVNTSGTTQSLAQLELTFTDPDTISSVWGSPWMNWQIAKSGSTYTLTGGTPYSTWANGATLTVSFTPSSSAVPKNVQIYQIPPAPLTACTVTASESAGTISIVNTSGAAIPLRQAQIDFNYAGTIASVWGTPWMAFTVAHTGTAYVLSGGTNDTTTLAAGSTLTAQFTPTTGAHATSIVFKAACGGSSSPAPTPSPTSAPTVAPTAAPTAKPTATPTAKPTSAPTAVPTAAPTAVPVGSPQFAGFWESWSDTNSADAFYSLSSVPAGVTLTDVAFSIADDNTIAAVQNTYPLLPGAQAIHGRGGKVLLSFGGATSQFAISNVSQFVSNLQAFMQANPGLYDGFDFDDEVMPWNGQQQLISVINATRAAFPNAIITMDAFMSGADPVVTLNTHQGEDIAVLQQAGNSLDYVNVMDYDQYGWHPSTNPNCSYSPGATDDCRLDTLHAFANIKMPSGATFPSSKIMMGLMIGSADDGAVITPANATLYSKDVRSLGYRGIMIWDLDRDSPGTTGYADGTYVNAITTALGT